MAVSGFRHVHDGRVRSSTPSTHIAQEHKRCSHICVLQVIVFACAVLQYACVSGAIPWGRSFYACINACNDARRDCVAECISGPKEERVACFTACNTQASVCHDECKMKDRSVKCPRTRLRRSALT